MVIFLDGIGCGSKLKITSELKQMEQGNKAWKSIATKYDLKESDLSQLASAWHTDLNLSHPFENMTDMSKSRKLGFKTYKPTPDSFIELFEKLRTDKLFS